MLPHPNIDKFGMSPLPLNHMDVSNLRDERQAWGLVSPPHSAVVYRLHDIHVIFLALLLIQVHKPLRLTSHRTHYTVSTKKRPPPKYA